MPRQHVPSNPITFITPVSCHSCREAKTDISRGVPGTEAIRPWERPIIWDRYVQHSSVSTCAAAAEHIWACLSYAAYKISCL